MRPAYDAVVVGTGFGGAVASCRLAQAGLSVGVIERGRRYDSIPSPFPRDFANVEKGWLWQVNQGLFDVKPIEEMLVVESAGYGGGSLIYANVHLRAVPDVFGSGWPTGYSREALDPYYDLVAYMLDIAPITSTRHPIGLPPKTMLMASAMEKLGRSAQFYYPNLAVNLEDPSGGLRANKFGVQQQGCRYCGECDIGCCYRAKNTLDMNYLAVAENNGADVATRSQVTRIEPKDGGYDVVYVDHAAAGVERRVAAGAVFVCGGAVNSTELLLRCRDEHRTLPRLSDSLGKHYSGNGDFLGFAFDTARPFNPDVGPTITSAVLYDRGEGDDRSWFTLQEGGYPAQVGVLFQLLREGRDWWPSAANVVREELEEAFKRAARQAVPPADAEQTARERAASAVFLAMGRDRANGQIALHPLTKQLQIQWQLADNLPLYGAEGRLVRDLAAALGGEPSFNPLWKLVSQPVSVHNLGGCCMADDPANGVVDGNGQVFGYPGLFVLDGAALPAATGVNPSHTIAAVAERNVEKFIRTRRREPGWAPPERASSRPIVDPVSLIQIPKEGTPATATAPIGLSFTETMKGFLVDASEVPANLAGYVEAEHAGQKANRRVEFTLTITAADLDAFLVDRTHAALAVGSVREGGVAQGAGARVTHGVFNLFVSTDRPDARAMLYSLPFVGADGRRYLLDGFKDVVDDGHFDVWHATSTLYTVLRSGSTHDDPVIAAGILRILIPDFLKQLTTFRVPGAENEVQRLEALGRFGRMFMGSLWDVFAVPHLPFSV